jgi:hypothetical protein
MGVGQMEGAGSRGRGLGREYLRRHWKGRSTTVVTALQGRRGLPALHGLGPEALDAIPNDQWRGWGVGQMGVG